jgi:hypothetical protein
MTDVEPKPEYLVLQAIRLARAQFDMRCAEAISWDLERHHDDHGPEAYGLLTGMAVSYARPFVVGEGNPYGSLESKWSNFPKRPLLKSRHTRLIELRNTLLAHNDRTLIRATIVWPNWEANRAATVEARALIHGPGVAGMRELFGFQESRFGEHVQYLVDRLRRTLGWEGRGEIDLDEELEALRAAYAPEARPEEKGRKEDSDEESPA